MPSAHHGRIEAVTLTVTDLDLVLQAYLEVLEQKLVARRRIPRRVASSWGAQAVEGREFALLEPASGCGFYLRLVEGPPPTQPPRTTWGWTALELSVRDADALHERLKTSKPFRVLAPPAALPGLPQIYPLQTEGPAGEVLYLNEIRGQLPDHDLPPAECFVDRVFIVVLGAPDLAVAADFYTKSLGFELANSYEIPIGVLNDAFDLPKETRYRLQTTCVGRRLNVEIDQFPASARPRVVPEGELPSAMAMVSFVVDELGPHVEKALGEVICRPEKPYSGRRFLVVRGEAGELVELIESD